MYNRIVAYWNIVANMNFCFLESGMQHSTVLDIDFVSNADAVYISANHGIEPDTALISHNYITHNSGIRGDKAILAELRVNSVDMKDCWHDFNN